ncbi:TcfC E-set like domain-containing protein [Pseudomonas sp. TH34]|uniref:TcfC E-set like domain-containing protein n=1 Tax=Pseudomonas sp. TH34 TaxID=2796399 RepID=UPI001913E34F|nr:TcfC E-set like domain-containing protein [Pseudomonas sp. TH34]MBK5408892.1 TcfC E-set like domain-containing protein [Pseudomonas sp. TH34]
MFAYRYPFRLNKLWLSTLLAVSFQAGAQVKVSYGVPEGFSAAEMDNGAKYMATFNGRTLPGFTTYSPIDGKLVFDSVGYEENGVSLQDIEVIRNVLSQVDYKLCHNGCDLKAGEYYVTIDKLRRSLVIRDSRNDYLAPTTTWGLVNNQALDLRASSEGYRALNLAGNTWLGMPSRSFGYMNWFANQTQTRNYRSRSQGVSSYYLQKNFSSTYLRAGKQNSIDYASGSVSTLLSPSFDQFLTFGSQAYLNADRNAGSLILYSTSEGNYEFYRNGRLILKRPAALGRNEISFVDLPGGYYPVEVRLVDRNGNLVTQENRQINNVNFSATGSGNTWSVTAGNEMNGGGQLVQGSMSRNMRQFYLNASAVSGGQGSWASEVNVTRPSKIGNVDINPTLGVLSGERTTGGYLNLSMTNDTLGSLMVSRYQNNSVSRFYWGAPSSSLSYSRNVGGTTLAYNYQKYNRGESQQAEVRWNYRPNGLWSTFSVGVQKDGYSQAKGSYGVYFNMTWMLDNVQASFSASQNRGQTQLSGDYRKDFQDSFGTSTTGVTVSRIDRRNNVNLYGSRSGTRGDASLNLGHSDTANNLDMNYRGMLAASADGIALGRYSNSGSAMLLKTPDVPGTRYGFSVEGSPVAGNGTYAIPLNSYSDVTFARVLSSGEDMDMNIEVPANIVRAHPGQVYAAQAKVDINMIYSGFLVDASGRPIGGTILETGDIAHPNGLFSIFSKSVLAQITVDQMGRRYSCDLRNATGNYYHCL